MDGTIAQLDKICDLADQYKALVMIDECHSSGFIGKTGPVKLSNTASELIVNPEQDINRYCAYYSGTSCK